MISTNLVDVFRTFWGILGHKFVWLLAPLAIGQQAYVMVCCPSCIRPSVRVLTFSLNIFSETMYRILEMFLPQSSSEFLEKIWFCQKLWLPWQQNWKNFENFENLLVRNHKG